VKEKEETPIMAKRQSDHDKVYGSLMSVSQDVKAALDCLKTGKECFPYVDDAFAIINELHEKMDEGEIGDPPARKAKNG